VRLVWARRARRDRNAIIAYIADQNPAAARRVAASIDAQLETLLHFPRLGYAGRVRGTRELVIVKLPYIVVYVLRDEVIQILHVWDGRSDLPPKRP
jgi:toxin ParE1/3/4